MNTALGAYVQHRYLNPSQPEMCWRDAVPLFAPLAPRPHFNYPYPVLDPMCNTPLYGMQGMGFIPGVGPLFNATGLGETFSWIKGVVWLGGGLGLGYLVGFLWRELRTSGPVANRRRNGRRRMHQQDAIFHLRKAGVNLNGDYDALHNDQVLLILDMARATGYRKRADASGSRGRMYYYYLQRLVNRSR